MYKCCVRHEALFQLEDIKQIAVKAQSLWSLVVANQCIYNNSHLGFEYPTLVAVSNVVRFQNWNEPLQAHLALTGDPTEMV